MKEIPALYDIARKITNDAGYDWYDPRTGKKHPAPKVRAKRSKKKSRRK